MPDWQSACKVLNGERALDPVEMPRPVATMLPPNERRRAPASVRWALGAAEDAMRGAAYERSEVASVFATSGGDGETLHYLCGVLASAARDVSPTRFHNSVHNAPAGYWSIAGGIRQPSVSLCGYDASFAAGLLEAATQVSVDHAAVLLVAYDLPYPQPLHATRPIANPLAIALLLSNAPGRSPLLGCRLRLDVGSQPSSRLPEEIEAVLGDNPAARALPLLAMLASGRRESVRLDYLDASQLVIEPL
jgi:hypothetical protein